MRRLILALPLLLIACGDPTKAEIVKKAEGVDSRAALERVLGRPQSVDKLGPIERWIYKAKDGEVTFVITGDTVVIAATK